MNALKDLTKFLEDGEVVEALVFGTWGWDNYNAPAPNPVPKERQGQLLTLDEASPMMEGWSFYGGFGSPSCPAVYIWTNQRVIWVTQYDGSTRLSSAPRNPMACDPQMPGG
jgi:hypothetical protein